MNLNLQLLKEWCIAVDHFAEFNRLPDLVSQECLAYIRDHEEEFNQEVNSSVWVSFCLSSSFKYATAMNKIDTGEE